MPCKKCNGLVISNKVFSINEYISADTCLNCGQVTYPNFSPALPPIYNIKGGRKGIPMMFRNKKGE